MTRCLLDLSNREPGRNQAIEHVTQKMTELDGTVSIVLYPSSSVWDADPVSLSIPGVLLYDMRGGVA
jgi:hypothetical protein